MTLLDRFILQWERCSVRRLEGDFDRITQMSGGMFMHLTLYPLIFEYIASL
jgi:hypothetical protein